VVAAALAALALGGCGSSSSSETSSTSASSSSTGSDAAGTEKTGQVRIVFERPATRPDAIGAELLKVGLIPQIAHKLATSFKLPHPLTLLGVNGLGQGPFYNPKNNSITLPYQFATLVLQTLKRSNPSWSGHQLGFAAGSVDGFLLEHEFGHALIANFDLPVLGNDEDAADQIATVLLLNSPNGSKLAAQAAEFFADFSGRQDPPALADYADVHALDLQRAYDILCDTAGSSRLSFRQVAALGVLPRSRLVQCPDEYAQTVDSIKQELEPHLQQPLNFRGSPG
jgi:putative metallopeptidase DUF4344